MEGVVTWAHLYVYFFILQLALHAVDAKGPGTFQKTNGVLDMAKLKKLGVAHHRIKRETPPPNLTEMQKQQIVDKHNTLRAQEGASDMLEMVRFLISRHLFIKAFILMLYR